MIIKLKDQDIEFEHLPFKIWNLYDKVVRSFEEVRLRESQELECQFFFDTFKEYIDTDLWGKTKDDDLILYLLKNNEHFTPSMLIKALKEEENTETLKKQVLMFKRNLMDTLPGMDFDYCISNNGYCYLYRTKICNFDDFENTNFEVRGKLHSHYVTYLLQDDEGETWFLTININDFLEDYLSK